MKGGDEDRRIVVWEDVIDCMNMIKSGKNNKVMFYLSWLHYNFSWSS